MEKEWPMSTKSSTVSSTSHRRPKLFCRFSPILAAWRLSRPELPFSLPREGRRRRITGHPLRPTLATASAYTQPASARMVLPSRFAHSVAQDRLRLRLRAWRTPRSRSCRRGRPTTARELTPAPPRRSHRPVSTTVRARPTLQYPTSGHVIRPSWEQVLRTAEGAAEGGYAAAPALLARPQPHSAYRRSRPFGWGAGDVLIGSCHRLGSRGGAGSGFCAASRFAQISPHPRS